MDFNDSKIKLTREGSGRSGRGSDVIKVLARRITHVDLTDADTAQTFAVGTLPAGSILVGVAHRVDAVGVGTSLSALLLTVGTSGNADRWIDDADCFTAVVPLTRQAAGAIGDTTDAAFPVGIAASTAVQAIVTSTGANLSVLTAFDIEIFVTYIAFEDPDA